MNRSVQEEAKELYVDQKWSFEKIGQKLGYSRQTIYNIAVKNQWPIRSKKQAVEAKVSKTATRMETLEPKVIELFYKGWSVRHIAGSLKLPIKTVKSVYDGLPELERKAISYKGSSKQIESEDLKQYLVKVWEMMGRPPHPPSVAAFNKVRQGLKEKRVEIPHSMTYVKRFGNWNSACKEAFKNLPVVIERRVGVVDEQYSEYDLLQDIKDCYADLDHLPSIQEYNQWRFKQIEYNGVKRASSPTIINRLFGWVNALRLLQESIWGDIQNGEM